MGTGQYATINKNGIYLFNASATLTDGHNMTQSVVGDLA